MAGDIYLGHDFGEAIYYNGKPYIRQGLVTQEQDASFGENDQQDLGNNNPNGTYDNNGVSFNHDDYNSDPFSSSWSLDQCTIATLPDYSSYDYNAMTHHKDYTGESGPTVFFTAPSDGELRVWGDDIDCIGKNGQLITYLKYDDGSSTSLLSASVGLRVTAGEQIQIAGGDDNGNLINPPDHTHGWAFLPDVYP